MTRSLGTRGSYQFIFLMPILTAASVLGLGVGLFAIMAVTVLSHSLTLAFTLQRPGTPARSPPPDGPH